MGVYLADILFGGETINVARIQTLHKPRVASARRMRRRMRRELEGLSSSLPSNSARPRQAGFLPSFPLSLFASLPLFQREAGRERKKNRAPNLLSTGGHLGFGRCRRPADRPTGFFVTAKIRRKCFQTHDWNEFTTMKPSLKSPLLLLLLLGKRNSFISTWPCDNNISVDGWIRSAIFKIDSATNRQENVLIPNYGLCRISVQCNDGRSTGGGQISHANRVHTEFEGKTDGFFAHTIE